MHCIFFLTPSPSGSAVSKRPAEHVWAVLACQLMHFVKHIMGRLLQDVKSVVIALCVGVVV